MNYLRTITGAILFVLLVGKTFAGPVWKVTKADIVIYGTSNLHDWEMVVKEVKSQQNILFSGGQLIIGNVDLTVPVQRIESGNSIMDGKAREALKGSTYPSIRFTAGSTTIPVSNNTFGGKIRGRLEIAGVLKEVEIPVNGFVKADKNLMLKGEYVIDMTGYNVKPPTAVFGTLKTGKEVKVSFTFELAEL